MKQFVGSLLLAFLVIGERAKDCVRLFQQCSSGCQLELVQTHSIVVVSLIGADAGFDCMCAAHHEARANWSLLLCTKPLLYGTIPRLSEPSPPCRQPAFA